MAEAERNADDAPHPARVLGAWADALIRGRRVALIGDAQSGLAEQLAASSSRKVHAYDPDEARLAGAIAAAAGGAVSFAPLSEALDMRAGAFDAVIVPDLTLTGDSEALVEAGQALLSPRGVLIVASPNPEAERRAGALGYYELYDLMSARFDHLRVLGQAPFSAYSVAEFAADGDPAVTIDTSLGGEEEPHWFIVAASPLPFEVEPYTLVQIPSAWRLSEGDRAGVDQSALAEAQLRLSLLEAEVDKLRQKERRARELAEERTAGATKLAARLAELESEVDKRRDESAQAARAKLNELEDARRRAEERVRTLQKRLEQQQRDFDRATQDLEEAHQLDLDRMLDRIAELEAGAEDAADTQRAHTVPPRPEPAAPAVVDADEPPSLLTARGFAFQIDELRRAVSDARSERDAFRARAKQADALEVELDALRREHAAALARLAQHAGGAGEAADGDADAHIAALEERLKERGRFVATLQAQLREGERVGRELLARLLEAEKKLSNGQSAAAEAPVAASDEQLHAQLQAVAQKCARHEADLEAAMWKIASLEEQLTTNDNVEVHDKLEAALLSAQEEIAGLRAELSRREP